MYVYIYIYMLIKLVVFADPCSCLGPGAISRRRPYRTRLTCTQRVSVYDACLDVYVYMYQAPVGDVLSCM